MSPGDGKAGNDLEAEKDDLLREIGRLQRSGNPSLGELVHAWIRTEILAAQTDGKSGTSETSGTSGTTGTDSLISKAGDGTGD